MKFSDKLKKLRHDNCLTQDELAEKLFVTRTAISRWETGKGYPGIDNLKMLSDLFQISIDDLISDEDIENKKLLEKKNARKMYWITIACFGVAVVFAALCYLLPNKSLIIISFSFMILYIVFASFAKPKYKRMEARRQVLSYVISKIVVVAVITVVMITTLL